MKYLLNISFLFTGLIFFGSALYNSLAVSTNNHIFVDTPKYFQIKVDHSKWDRLLKKYVDDQGFVDYKGFATSKGNLEDYLKYLSQNPPTNSWSKEEVLAYYINLYNAGTVGLILENYPLKSIKDISRPWTKERISVGSKMISLDDIEHGILRKMGEPRIHFALNCASISCPKLSNDAYTSKDIYTQLEKAAKEFIRSDKNDINLSHPTISPIFDWYCKDFIQEDNTVIDFINRYAKIKVIPDAKISYKKYDWRLNEKK